MRKMFALLSLLVVASLLLAACGAPATPAVDPVPTVPATSVSTPIPAVTTPPTPVPGGVVFLLIIGPTEEGMDVSLSRIIGVGDPWEWLVYFQYPGRRVKALGDSIMRLLATDRQVARGTVVEDDFPTEVEVVNMDNGENKCEATLLEKTEVSVTFSVACPR